MENNIEQAIARHFSGEATAEDTQVLRQWINASQSNLDEYKRINLAYQLTSSKGDSLRKYKVYNDLVKRIQSNTQPHNKRNKKFHIRYLPGVAAAVVLLLSFSLVYFSKTFSEKKITGDELIVKTNPIGQKLKIFLPDGSIAWLNSSSELRYQKEFNDSLRNIYLSGEAYFEVIKDKSRPFVVHTGLLATTATGTSFNIDAFDQNKIIVSLTSGSVDVEVNMPNRKPILVQLKSGEGAVYDPSADGEIQKIPVDITSVKAWKDGILRFSNASLEETVLTLERWYGVEITILNSGSRQWKVNGVFDNEYLENVLNSLAFSQVFEYSIHGKNVNINIK